MQNEKSFVSSKIASKILGVHPETLRRMDKNNQINVIRTGGGKRMYDINEYINKNVSIQDYPSDKISVCYCRVSTNGQKNDLERQKEYLQERYPTHKIISDIGSGINFKRKGLQTILELAHRGELNEVVVAYRDRLCRFGYELFEWIFKTQSNAKIVVLNKSNNTKEQELTEDLLQILHVFSARSCGSRSYKNKKIEESEKRKTSSENEEDHNKSNNTTKTNS